MPFKKFWKQFQGAESFAVKDGYLYTGIHGGDIVRLQINAPKQPWEYVTKIGELCTDLHQEEICGRILGLEFDPKGNTKWNHIQKNFFIQKW